MIWILLYKYCQIALQNVPNAALRQNSNQQEKDKQKIWLDLAHW